MNIQQKGKAAHSKQMHEALAESQAGKLAFPEVVRRLPETRVESYFCDLAVGAETFYVRDGKTHVEKMTLPLQPIAKEFRLLDSSRQFAARKQTRFAIRSSSNNRLRQG